jgi:hypothetical protein
VTDTAQRRGPADPPALDFLAVKGNTISSKPVSRRRRALRSANPTKLSYQRRSGDGIGESAVCGCDRSAGSRVAPD